MLVYLAVIDEPAQKTKFETVYHQYRGLMYYGAYRILNNASDAEDAVHDAFIKIAENMKKISDPVCPKTQSYVVTIVENKAIDLYRRKQRRGALPLEETEELSVSPQEPMGLAECILKLPPSYRQVILLKYHQGFSCGEIAAMLGITLSAAQKLDQRAKEKLRQIAEKEGIL